MPPFSRNPQAGIEIVGEVIKRLICCLISASTISASTAAPPPSLRRRIAACASPVQIGSELMGMLYVWTSPASACTRDNLKMIGTLGRLRDLGNTVIVVEHDETTMRCRPHYRDRAGGGRPRRPGDGLAVSTPSSITPTSLTGAYLTAAAISPPPLHTAPPMATR
ncbi:MAG: hypothetical protein R2911_34630 [Caldilineaceae bacterium]